MEAVGKRLGHLLRCVVSVSYIRTLLVGAWRGKCQQILRTTYVRAIICLAPLYRIVCLRRVVFIGVTGSAGKTTAKEFIAAVLSSQGKVRKTHRSANLISQVAMTIMRTRPSEGVGGGAVAGALAPQALG
jgi:UDP-N-acetylmuramyl pentapeptide synthase